MRDGERKRVRRKNLSEWKNVVQKLMLLSDFSASVGFFVN
jgi:hypothetical protein